MVVSGTLLISTGTYDIAVYSIPSSGSLVTARVTRMYSETMARVCWSRMSSMRIRCSMEIIHTAW